MEESWEDYMKIFKFKTFNGKKIYLICMYYIKLYINIQLCITISIIVFELTVH